jgi:hypothetical protein
MTLRHDKDSTARAKEAHKHKLMLGRHKPEGDQYGTYTHIACTLNRRAAVVTNDYYQQALDTHLRADITQHNTGKFKAGV